MSYLYYHDNELFVLPWKNVTITRSYYYGKELLPWQGAICYKDKEVFVLPWQGAICIYDKGIFVLSWEGMCYHGNELCYHGNILLWAYLLHGLKWIRLDLL